MSKARNRPRVREVRTVRTAWRASGARHPASGASTSEYVLMVAVIVVATLAAAQVFMGGFSAGVAGLSRDVASLLSLEDGAGSGRGGGGPGTGQASAGDPLPPIEDSDVGSVPSLPEGSTAEQPPPADGDSAGDGGAGDGSDAGDQDEESSDDTCPYVFDEASDRWRDPETGQYVSFDAATAAGC